MSELLKKSQLNKDAAQLLYDQFHFAPSVHCSYYSFLQAAQDFINSTLNITNEQLISKHSTIKARATTHAAIRNELSEIIKKRLKYKAQPFHKKVQMLVQRRVNSDYTQIAIDYSEARIAQSESEELKEILIELKRVL